MLTTALPPHVIAQELEESRPARSLLVGRRETATIDLTRIGVNAMDALLPWRHGVPPLTESTRTAARLWSDLPITIGKLQVPPGNHLLRIENGRTLVITREHADSSAAGDALVGRVELDERPSGVAIAGWSLYIVTTRLGEDTISVDHSRLRSRDVIALGYGPATRSILRLRWLDRELSVPIAAR